MALVGAAFLAGSIISGATAAVAVTSVFNDVPNNHPFLDQINWMSEQGIAQGYDDGTFKPTAPVSRQAFASFLNKYNASIQRRDSVSDPAPNTEFLKSTDCLPGQRAIGGGGQTNASGLVITDSLPHNGDDGWQVRWESKTGAVVDPSMVTAYAICVPEL